MNGALQIFNNAEFGAVRTIKKDDQIWFVGKDVCQAFGDKNHNRSIGKVSDSDKIIETIIDSLGRNQNTIFINESGLYSLLFQMRPQKANNNGVSDAYPIEVKARIEKLERFKHWVTSEVLPSVRKHGAYMTPQKIEEVLMNPDTIIQLAQSLKSEQAKVRQLETKVRQDSHKVLFADSVTASETSISVGELAKILKQNGIEIGQKRLFKYLRQNGYLIKRKGTDWNMPTQRSMEQKLFTIKETTITHSDGHTSISKTVKVTGKGQIYFVNLFLDEEKEACRWLS